MSKAASSIRRGLDQAVAFAKGTASKRTYRTAKQRGAKRRRVCDEIMEGIGELKAHREGRLTLLSYKIEPPTLTPVDPNAPVVPMRRK